MKERSVIEGWIIGEGIWRVVVHFLKFEYFYCALDKTIKPRKSTFKSSAHPQTNPPEYKPQAL
jgi:hypothetical protein